MTMQNTMQAALALLPFILQAIPTVEIGVENLIAWVASLRSAAKQTGEWTDAMESAFLDTLIATKTDPAYQPDPVPVVAPPVPVKPPGVPV